MEKRFLEKNADNFYGCGPCALSYLTGVEPFNIKGWMVSYRAANPISDCGLPCKRRNACGDTDGMFDVEIEAFLSMFARKEMKFKPVCRQNVISFARKLPRNNTYLIISDEHAMVARNGRFWDTRGANIKNPFWSAEIAVGYVRIPWIIANKK